MQDEVNEKTVSLCIRGGKITAQLLKAAMRKALAQMEQEKAKQKQQSKVSEKIINNDNMLMTQTRHTYTIETSDEDEFLLM